MDKFKLIIKKNLRSSSGKNDIRLTQELELGFAPYNGLTIKQIVGRDTELLNICYDSDSGCFESYVSDDRSVTDGYRSPQNCSEEEALAIEKKRMEELAERYLQTGRWKRNAE